MVFVDGETKVRSADEGKVQLQRSIQASHVENLVFGDLRAPDVIVQDFGKKIKRGDKITKEHDLHLLERLVSWWTPTKTHRWLDQRRYL